MFKILGADGKEYGPVTTGQLHQWIREGRAGGQTQVRAAGATVWTPLSAQPEFAEIFRTPPAVFSGAPGSLPPVVRTLAMATFVVAGLSALMLLVNIVSILRLATNGSFKPGFLYYFSWIVAALSIPIRVVSGVGLLRARERARKLTVYFSAAMALYGGWGLSRTAIWFFSMTDFTGVLRSPMFLVMNLWTLALFAFNIATAVLLSRKDVRSAFVQKSSSAA